jgi:type VI secretion system ImpC/EvpB family protein
MAGRMEFDVSVGGKTRRRGENEPMQLLVIGDLSGRPVADRPPLANRPIQRVDVDNLDAVVRRLDPRVELPAGAIHVQHIDDFHPDRLFARLDLFERLRATRASPVADDEQIARLLGTAPRPTPTASPTGIDALIRDAVAPYVVSDTSARTAAHVAAVDAAIAQEMRALLHAPAFQSLEAIWRGIHRLISNLELDDNLQLHLFDVTREEILADIVAARGAIADTAFHRAVVERTRTVPDGRGWSALIGLFRFGASDADMGLLAALGQIAVRAGCPWLGDADLGLVADPAAAFPAWSALRRSEVARWIALAAPRVLLRLPYGQRSDPIEAFRFDEFAGAPAQDELLWGPASLAMALLIGRSFVARGWEMEPGDENEIGDLPAYTFERDGESQLQPAAERAITERDADTMLKSGLVPIASRRDRNAVVAVRFQSIADPPAALAW